MAKMLSAILLHGYSSTKSSAANPTIYRESNKDFVLTLCMVSFHDNLEHACTCLSHNACIFPIVAIVTYYYGVSVLLATVKVSVNSVCNRNSNVLYQFLATCS